MMSTTALLLHLVVVLLVATSCHSFTIANSKNENCIINYHQQNHYRFKDVIHTTISKNFDTTNNNGSKRRTRSSALLPLFMGRAAAVRAATKGKTDAKKAKTNAVYGKKIIMAVKQGGSPNPDANSTLKDLIAKAKANSVPMDNINRAIKKATESNTADFSESTFEAYGFGGASFVVNVLTDNNNRASADVKATIGKNGGKIAEQGSVLFMYDRKGKIEVETTEEIDEEALLDAAIEKDIDDFELIAEGDEEGTSIVYTEPSDVAAMAEAIQETLKLNCKFTLAYVTKAPVECTDEDFENNMKIYDSLMELDDVDSVEHNMSN